MPQTVLTTLHTLSNLIYITPLLVATLTMLVLEK